MSKHKHNFRRPNLEQLENRALLAGNIQATFTDGNLQITGDDRDNGLLIYEVAPGSGHYRLEGLDSGGARTRINGQASIDFRRVFGNLSIEMRGGDDQVQLGAAGQAMTHEKFLSIETGYGDDVVAISDSQLGKLKIVTGNGNDLVSLTNSSVRYHADFTTSTGDDEITLCGVAIGYGLDVFAGAGADRVALSGVQVGYDLNVHTGEGDDWISLFDTSSEEEIRIDTQDGDDLVALDRVSADAIFADLGEGRDELSLARCRARLGNFSGQQGGDYLLYGVCNYFAVESIDGFER